MLFAEKLQILRKSNGYTQEELAEKLGVSRQSIAKYEAGQGYPDIMNLIQISNLFHVTVDYLVKDQECSVSIGEKEVDDIDELIQFRLEANRATYAANSNKYDSTRLDSKDFRYEKGNYVYHDTYLGGEQFAGQEAIWKNGKAVYAMNYFGRVTGENFSSDFLKEALRAATYDCPYRGPIFYQSGEYTYATKVTGDIHWFQGVEEIYHNNLKIYECYYQGGLIS